jgi:hypothetical protein
MTDLDVELQDDVSKPVRTGKGLAGRIEPAHATNGTRDSSTQGPGPYAETGPSAS